MMELGPVKRSILLSVIHTEGLGSHSNVIHIQRFAHRSTVEPLYEVERFDYYNEVIVIEKYA